MIEIFKAHNIDARKIETVITEPIVDVTITSPPYFDLKDYGSDDQIGYGQNYDDYLSDLRLVFEQVYKVTKETGTLWVIIDVFRRDGEVVPLPFDFSNRIKEIGWKLQEVIIWGKDRTVPWTHKGQMRNLFEYILIFSKTDNYNFYLNEVRDCESLKKWWVKYPERYNPKGKTPDAIWNFEIPTQGSWGRGYIKHFCPLPEEMIAQMLKLTTKVGDVVLDCFSGSGAVLSKADNMRRKYIGFELNNDYITMFENYLHETGDKKRKEYDIEERNLINHSIFEKLILDLRALKYARVFYKKLKENDIHDVLKIKVERSTAKPLKNNSIQVVKYNVLLKNENCKEFVEVKLNELIQKAPLSKFGIEPIFDYIINKDDFLSLLGNGNLFLYSHQTTHKFKKKFDIQDMTIDSNINLIISEIKVELDEKDYE